MEDFYGRRFPNLKDIAQIVNYFTGGVEINMLILWYPMFSVYRNLNSDSHFIIMKNYISAILKEKPNWCFLIPWPSGKEWIYYHDEFFNNKQILRYPFYFPTKRHRSVVQYDIKVWDRLFKLYTPDVLWMHAVEISHNLKKYFDQVSEQNEAYVLNHHHYIVHKSLPYAINKDLNVLYNQLVSAVLASQNTFYSRYSLWMLWDNFKTYFGKIPRFEHEVIPPALYDKERWNKLKLDSIKPYEKLTFLYNHRLSLYKDWKTTFELFKILYDHYPGEFQVIVTAVNAMNVQNVKSYPFVKIKANTDHDKYLKEAAKCHVNTMNTKHETYNFATSESLMLGHILVAPNGITFPEKVPAGYPFLFNNKTKQYNLLKKIIKTYKKEGNDMFKTLREHTKQHHRNLLDFERWATLYTRLIINDQNKKRNVLRSLKYKYEQSILKSLSRLKLPQPLSEIDKHLRKEANLGSQAFPPLKIKRLLTQLGYEDEFVRNTQHTTKGA